jgi:hypothetical protein
MIIGVGIAVVQTISSSAYFGLVNETPDAFRERVQTEPFENRWLREKLFDSTGQIGPLSLCRWQTVNGIESQPTSANCKLEAYDVVLRPSGMTEEKINSYLSYFEGSTRRIHLCQSCQSKIVIEQTEKGIVSDVHGFVALAIYNLSDNSASAKISSHYADARDQMEEIKNITGTVRLHPDGFPHPLNMTEATKTMLLIFNTSLITIIALWLSLKGHRKVLDYFARNGALLPLVAACGKKTFYASLWIITLIRVGFFLLAALPATVVMYVKTVPDDTLAEFMGSPLEFLLYLCGIITSLSCLAIIASIAELKHRHTWLSFLYRYVPLSLAFLGTIVWFICIFTAGDTSAIIQKVIACIPIIGISPILVSPLFELHSDIIAVHSSIASILVILMLKVNSQWFAAHLEEI